MNILVVDPHEDVGALVRMALEFGGHSVATAMTMQHALKMVTEHDFGGYLINLGIAPGGGFVLLEKLDELAYHRRGKGTRTAVAWDASLPEDWNRVTHGFQSFLLKPASLGHIDDALHGRDCASCGRAFQPHHDHGYCGTWIPRPA